MSQARPPGGHRHSDFQCEKRFTTLWLTSDLGEIQALAWDNVDLENGVIHIRATYVRREKITQNHPKGKKWHSVTMPLELLEMMKTAKTRSEGRRLVVSSPRREMLNYDGYLKALKRYCRDAGLPDIATHGLRHSTAGLYLEHGATTGDMCNLFAHSSEKVTARYIHTKDQHVDRVAKVIRLFPETVEGKSVSQADLSSSELVCSKNVPIGVK